MLYEFDHHKFATEVITTNTTASSQEPDDEMLMAGIQHQDEKALELLLQRHRPLLRTIVGRVVNNDADVDDLVQEVFVEIWHQATHYDRAKGKALGWIVTLARRRAIDRVRKKLAYQRAQDRLVAETEKFDDAGMQQGADEDAIAADRNVILRQVIERLPEAQREAIQLAYYRGLSQREIAKLTGTPLGTIKTRLELAVRKVRSAVLSLGGASEWTAAV